MLTGTHVIMLGTKVCLLLVTDLDFPDTYQNTETVVFEAQLVI